MITKETRAILYALLAIFSWSTVATAFKMALSYLSYFELLLISCSTAFVIFTGLIIGHGKWRMLTSLSRKQWLFYAFLGLLNPVVYYLTLFKSYSLLPAQIAQPINYIWPILLLILLAVFVRQPIARKKYIGMFLSLLGVVLISSGAKSIDGANISVEGLLLALLSALFWAVYWMVNNKYKEKNDAEIALFASFFFGTLYMVLFVLTGMASFHCASLPSILSGAYVGAFEMGVPFIFFSLALRDTSNPTLVNQLCYLAPFFSLFFISMILGEKIVPTTYVGLVLIISGILFNQYLLSINWRIFFQKRTPENVRKSKFKK